MTTGATVDTADVPDAAPGTCVVPRPSPRSWWLLVGLTAVLAVPLLVALGVLHSPRWYPLLDLAQTELRVRDVFTSHTPLIGLPGRFGTFPDQGSHPGPLSFYVLWLFYKPYGSSAFALQAATASMHIVVLAVMLWVARRRGGMPLMLVVGVLAGRLYASYGAAILTEGWNPFMPVTWWFLFLLAIWSVACADFVVLPVAVVAASFCMQTHVPYLGLAGAVFAFTAVGTIVYTYRSRASSETKRAMWKWFAISAVLGLLLWVPPLYEQATQHPGNLTVVTTDLRHPRDTVTGVREGLRIVLTNLNPGRLFTDKGATPQSRAAPGTLVPGILLCVAFAASCAVALRTRRRSLVTLHAIAALALVFGFVSASRIAGITYFYLLLWLKGITVVLLFAIGATVVAVVGERLDDERRERALRIASAVMVVLILVQTAAFAVDAAHTEVPNPGVTRTVGKVAGPTVRALESGTVPGGGRDGRYLVTWNDAMTLGARGYSLLLELERNGFHVGGSDTNRVGITKHRVMFPSQATAEVHLTSGQAIEAWEKLPGERRVAYYDPRNAAQRARFEQLRTEVVAELHRRGLDQLAQGVEGDNLALAFTPSVPADVLPDLQEMLDLGLPVAVFVGPPRP